MLGPFGDKGSVQAGGGFPEPPNNAQRAHTWASRCKQRSQHEAGSLSPLTHPQATRNGRGVGM